MTSGNDPRRPIVQWGSLTLFRVFTSAYANGANPVVSCRGWVLTYLPTVYVFPDFGGDESRGFISAVSIWVRGGLVQIRGRRILVEGQLVEE